MTRQDTKFKGLRALRLLLYRNPEGLKMEDILRQMDLQVDRVRDRTNIWRWLREIGAQRNEVYGVWVLHPSADEIEYAEAVMAAAQK